MHFLVALVGWTAPAVAAPFAQAASSILTSTLPQPTRYTLPHHDPNIEERKLEVQQKQDGILYGPSRLGNAAFSPSGPLGDEIATRDQLLWVNDSTAQVEAVARESAAALASIQEHGGLRSVDDFEILYDGHWEGSVPLGIARGQFSNKTSDLLFSMERLSTNPYILKRLHPIKDNLPFDVDEQIVQELTASTLISLHKSGRLFLADHSYQREYVPQEGRYTAACSALFYIDERSNQLLPLAIKTNVGSDLIYTPLDEPNDWNLAKIMFNVNDLFQGQMYHLGSIHVVAEIVYLPALRTLSSRHPILRLLDRLMYQIYAIRPVGATVLFNPGGSFDQNFALSAATALTFAEQSYPISGRFRSNYLETDLRARGLLNATYGPSLPDFPFYEDGSKIIGVIRKFVRSFVEETYKSDEDISHDWELQAWIAEANGPAEVLDFLPVPLHDRQELVDIISHLAWLTGVSHHVLNQGDPVTASGVLPFHPASLYAPIPLEKGVENVLDWLPNEQKSVDQISTLARFNRPQVIERRQTLQHMFNDPELLSGSSDAISAANQVFMDDMDEIGEEISNRHFDSNGLSQGMPFVWTGMDPRAIPFFSSV